MPFTPIFRHSAVLISLVLSGCATPDIPVTVPDATAFVVLGENGMPVARVLTTAAQCPLLTLDGRDTAMHLRAGPTTIALRPTRSAPADSKPSAFPLLTCEKVIPPATGKVVLAGRMLPLPPAEVRRIVVIGDTGCRLKSSDRAFQACNDENEHPFARVAAAAAAWQPELVIHVGDYHYRENACPPGNAGCAGSAWGYGWDAWHEDFFKPAAPLLRTAPWVVARGNHESCSRAGQGWWRFLDPRALQARHDCNEAVNDDLGDYSDPYAVPLGGNAQLIVLDTSNAPGEPVRPGDIRNTKYRDMYRKFEALAKNSTHSIGVDHHPILGFASRYDKQGKITLMPGNQGLQSVFGTLNPLLLPTGVDVMLSGHYHVWQQVSFSTPHPTQFITGFSGTMEETLPMPAVLPPGATPAPGAVVAHLSSWVAGFGYMTMERQGANTWDIKVWDVSGRQVNACRITGSKSVCDVARVKS